MSVRSIMLVAGETSGDLLAAELVRSLGPHFEKQPFPPKWFGAGGERMEAAGVEIVQEMTRHAVVGVGDVARSLARYRRIFNHLLDTACARQPDLVVLVDFTGFNRRFAHALRHRIARQSPVFGNWRPRIVQYVSPQVWASRPGRGRKMARDIDLLLCLFPFETEWYAQRVPGLRVEWVGHPICDRYPQQWEALASKDSGEPPDDRPPLLLLLPGSRRSELQRHLPVMLEATRKLAGRKPLRVRIVLPGDHLLPMARQIAEQSGARLQSDAGDSATRQRLSLALGAKGSHPTIPLEVGGLATALEEARVAIASTGTVTLECALFGVPTVALYKTSWLTYQIARQLVTVDYMAMPNILAKSHVFPEFIQDDATPENLAAAAGNLLPDSTARRKVQFTLRKLAGELGGPGASDRAAEQIRQLVGA
jgi:lipid-A-disaccharide synthase